MRNIFEPQLATMTSLTPPKHFIIRQGDSGDILLIPAGNVRLQMMTFLLCKNREQSRGHKTCNHYANVRAIELANKPIKIRGL
jgi:hypothetical protein